MNKTDPAALAGLRRLLEFQNVGPAPREGRAVSGDAVPLTPGQERLWDASRAGNAGLNRTLCYRLSGELDLSALNYALDCLRERHPILSARFYERDGIPCMLPGAFSTGPLVAEQMWVPQGDAELITALNAVAAIPFDLFVEPPFRLRLWRMGADSHVLCLEFHHIAFDYWSLDTIHRELERWYRTYRAGESGNPPRPRLSYADYAVWQREWLQTPDLLEDLLRYWAAAPGVRNASSKPILQAPRDAAFQPGRRLQCEWSEAFARGLKEFAGRQGFTLYPVLLSAFFLVLHQFGGRRQEEFSICSPVAGRHRGEFAGLVGFFNNLVLLNANLRGDPGFVDLIARVRETTDGALAHQDLPFQYAGRLAGSGGRPTEIMFSLLNIPHAHFRLQDLVVEALGPVGAYVDFGLFLYMEDHGRGIRMVWEYSSVLFSAKDMGSLADHFQALLGWLIENPHAKISQAPRPADEALWAAAAGVEPGSATVGSGPTPDVPVEQAMRDAELEARVSGLAAELREELRGTPVGLKAGPVDPEAMRADLQDFLAPLLPAAADWSRSLVALGVDSLLALRLRNRIRRVHGVDIAPGFVLQGAKLSDLIAGAARSVSHERLDMSALITGPSSDGAEGAAQHSGVLSHGQSALWFLHHSNPEDPAYNVARLMRVGMRLDSRRMNHALRALAARHRILRSVIRTVDDLPAGPEYSAHVPECEILTGVFAKPAEARAALLAEHRRPFDLENGPLWRVAALETGDTETYLLLSFHHIIVDHRSLRQLANELKEIYETGLAARCRPVRDYSDFAKYQRALLAGPRGPVLADYWRRIAEAHGGLPLLDLPLEGHPGERGGAQLDATPGESTLKPIMALAREIDATLATVLLAGFLGVLHRASGEADVVIGMLADARPEFGFDDVPGYYSNALLIRSRFEGDPALREFLAAVRDCVAAAFDHREYPFSLLIEELDLQRESGRTPGFQVLFNYVDARSAGDHAQSDSGWSEMPLVQQETQFDLICEAIHTDRGLSLAYKYNRSRYTPQAVDALRESHMQFLKQLPASFDRDSLYSIELLGSDRQAERRQWNSTRRAFDSGERIEESLARAASRRPDKTALVFENEELSYGQFQCRVEELADRLRARGAGPGARVGIYLRRSLEMAIALPAVLRSGAAYIPLDPDYPEERLALILEDARPELIIADAPTGPPGFAGRPEQILTPTPADETSRLVESEPGPVAAAMAASAQSHASGVAARKPEPNDPAYILFTSGSTGRPRGVIVSHRNVQNFFAGMDDVIQPLAEDPGVWLAVTSISFDISVLELLWTLSRGFTTVIQADRAPPIRDTRSLDFSLFFFGGDDQNGPDSYRLLTRSAQYADQHDFTGVWLPERHFHRFGGLFPNPSVLAASLAVLTERIRIRAGSVVLPLHHPARVTEEWSVVDNLSGGRVELSFASGWHPADFALAPENYADRHAIMARYLDQVRRLWRGETLILPGGDGREARIAVHPRPVQPELPFFLTAATNPETFRQAGRAGGGVLTHLLGQDLEGLAGRIDAYRAARREAGVSGPGRVVLMLHAFVSEDREFALRTARGPLRDYIQSSATLARSAIRAFTDSDAAELSAADAAQMLERTLDRYMSEMGLFGSPESCHQFVQKLNALGVDEIACLLDFGVAPDVVLEHLPVLKALRERANGSDCGPRSTQELIEQCGVTHMQCTPSFAAMLMEDAGSAAALQSVSTLLIGGEAFPPDLAAALHGGNSGQRILNMYGPTETTIWSSVARVADPKRLTIGRPIANTEIQIRNQHGGNALPGVPGEIWIGGEGVADGYLDQPEATAERFVFEGDRRLYRTGDRGRFLPDGEIEFLGRLDHQIKLRGHRIEPGEIEARLRELPAVREALVVLNGATAAEQVLVAYLICEQDAAAQSSPRGEMRQSGELHSQCLAHLSLSLPTYMLPAFFIAVPRWPLTPNGKIDRKALPAPQSTRPEKSAGGAPRTSAERKLATIWCAVLKRESIGLHDNFFALGGNSLLAFQAVARIRRDLSAGFQLRDFMSAQTVAGQALLLFPAQENSAVPARTDWQSRMVPQVGGDPGAHSRANSLVVPLRGGPDARKNLFLAPPSPGNPLCYLPLAACLHESVATYGFESPGMTNGNQLCFDAVKLARKFLAAMRTVQPGGPYYLGGWSFGGQVAFEMARLLWAEGQVPAALFLIDCPLRGGALADAMSWKSISGSGPDPRRILSFLGLSSASTPGAVPNGAGIARVPGLVSRLAGDLVRIMPGFAANVVAEMRYRPAPLPVDGYYFVSRGALAAPAEWRSLFTGELNVVSLSGGHLQVFEEQNLSTVARVIRQALGVVGAETEAGSPGRE